MSNALVDLYNEKYGGTKTAGKMPPAVKAKFEANAGNPGAAPAHIFSALLQIGQGKAHPIFFNAEYLVVVGMQPHHGDELFLALLRRTINVRIVHGEPPHSQQPRQLTGLLIAVTGAVLGKAQR